MTGLAQPLRRSVRRRSGLGQFARLAAASYPGRYGLRTFSTEGVDTENKGKEFTLTPPPQAEGVTKEIIDKTMREIEEKTARSHQASSKSPPPDQLTAASASSQAAMASVPLPDQLAVASASLQTAMANVSHKLGLFERVRHVCRAAEIPLPGVVVVGEQSAGKSSLLENISGIQFPRAQNTCTRMPWIVTLLADSRVKEPFVQVSLDPSFAKAKKGSMEEFAKLTVDVLENHPSKDPISKEALYIRVVRTDGPQLSLIDLPGITHNAAQMDNIHQVTAGLVEEYIKPEEMVILCVIPATSDFGNAEVLKLAKKYDPDGIRTLGVVTKCDDAANAESSDLLEKVLMSRPSDVKLEMGFHCVVNRSQKNIDEKMSRENLWAKEKKLFTESDLLKLLPERNWGTYRLMEKIGRLQEASLDKNHDRIKEAVRKKIAELEEDSSRFPAQTEDKAGQFSQIISSMRKDLEGRVNGESFDFDFTIAPIVDEMILKFKQKLQSRNPNWMGNDMIHRVRGMQSLRRGYTVDNMTGPHAHVFINLIEETFIKEALLEACAHELVEEVVDHLTEVLRRVTQTHAAKINGILPSQLEAKAEDCIDCLQREARDVCEKLALAQKVTSTTNDRYMARMLRFRSCLSQLSKGDGTPSQICGEFLPAKSKVEEDKLVKLFTEASKSPEDQAVLEICASLQAYTEFMIECFVETSAKLVKFYMVEQLVDKLEDNWRRELSDSTTLQNLFAEDAKVAQQRKETNEMMDELLGFKEELRSLQPVPVVPVQGGKRRHTAKVQPPLKTQTSSTKQEGTAKVPPFEWKFTEAMKDKTFKKGDKIMSDKFRQLEVPDLQLAVYPQGSKDASDGHISVYLHFPTGWQIRYKARLGDVERVGKFGSQPAGWHDFAPISSGGTALTVEILEATPPSSAS